jgi:putative MATE family efflux protein
VARGTRDREQDRQILALAVPAFAALVAEPLFLLADSAIVGHLGTLPLAGLGIAAAVLSTVIGLCVFLAYGTTAGVARRLGADDLRGALAMGVDGVWLALGLGLVLWAVTAAAAPWLVTALGASEQVAPSAVAYLRWSLPGVPAMLVVLAATGVLRGLQDTRTPLVVAVSGAVANVVLNYVLVYPVGMGIAGSGLGTSLAQIGMAVALTRVVVRAARREGAPLRPDRPGIVAAARGGVPLVVRSVAMRAVLLVLAAAAAVQGDAQLAGHQVVFTIWIFTSFVLDALAIAGQALTGRFLGAGDVEGARSATRRMVQWGLGFGAVVGVLLLLSAPWVGRLFTPDAAVQAVIAAALVPAALTQPISGYVFVLDGVLIGAGDGRYLGLASAITAAVFVPLAGLVLWVGPGGTAGLVWLWVAFTVGWMGARTATLWARERSGRWLVTGAAR